MDSLGFNFCRMINGNPGNAMGAYVIGISDAGDVSDAKIFA
jgi:hypothetical protein